MESSESTQEETREKYPTLLNFHLRVPSRVYDVEGVTIFSKNRVEPPVSDQPKCKDFSQTG